MARDRSFWMLQPHPIRQSSNYATHPLHSAICCPSHWCLYNLCLVLCLHSTWCWETQTTGLESIAVDVDEVDTLSIKYNHHDRICTNVKNLPQIKRKWLLHLCSVRKHSGSNQKFLNILFKTSFCSSAPIKYVENYKIWYLLHMFTIRKSLITYADTSRWITCASYRPIYKLNTDIRYNGPILGAHGTQTLFILYSEEKRPAILSDSKSK